MKLFRSESKKNYSTIRMSYSFKYNVNRLNLVLYTANRNSRSRKCEQNRVYILYLI